MICKYCKKTIQDGSVYCNFCGKKQDKAKPKHRRANGTGSVYKLSGKRAKPWVALGRTTYVDGVPQINYIGTFETKSQAEEAITESKLKPTSAYRDITLSGLWEMYKETKQYTSLSDSGKRWNKLGFNHMKLLQSQKFADIRRNDFQKCIDEYEDAVSYSTLSAIRSMATLLSDYAVSLDIVPHSYATRLMLPKKGKRTLRQMPIFSDEEVKKIFESSGEWEDTIKILLCTGMRINEFLNVKSEDIHDGMIYCKGTKTDVADRVIPIHPKIKDIIASRMNNIYIASGDKKMRDDKYRKNYYYPTLEKIGVSAIEPHGCRRWFSSKIDKYCDDKVGMALVMGHTDPAFTQRKYVTADMDRLQNVIDSIVIC